MEHALNLVVHYNIFREKLVTKKIMTILIMFFFRYDFTSHIDVYEEYLIYDEIGMIGSVGQRQC